MWKIILTFSIILSSCVTPSKVGLKSAENNVGEANITNVSAKSNSAAEVTKVDIIGTANDYSFTVTVNSPDTGCDNYADWWEVVTTEGELLYRRVLLHSHVDEQPFTRSGGTVAIPPQQEVIVRVHMSADGYSDSRFER